MPESKNIDTINIPWYIYYDKRSTIDNVSPIVPMSITAKCEVMILISISSDIIRGYNDTMILCLLMSGPSYGYEISKRIRQMTAEKYVIKETTLYSAFNRMEKNGFIVSSYRTSESGKRRTYYTITQSGVDYYRGKCAEWNLTKDVVEKFIIRGD